jgi:HlyD family secretion protein
VKKLLFFLVLIGLGLAGVAWWLSREHNKAPDPNAYTYANVEFGRISEVVSATGLVQPREVFPVGTELAGKVVAVLADFNQTVEEGDPLVRLDDRMARQRLRQAELAVQLARIQVKQAQASRDAAEKAAERERRRSPQVRSQIELDLAEAQLHGADVAVEAARVKVQEAEEARRQAELALRLTTVRVPVLARNGEETSHAQQHLDRPGIGTLAPEGTTPEHKRSFIVLDRKVSLNQEVGPPASAQLFTLAGSLDRMQVVTQVVEGDIFKIRRGLKANFTVAGGGDNEPTFHGTVEDIRLVPTSNHGAVFYNVLIDIQNQRDASGDWLLRPGLTASVDIVRRAHDRAWKLPNAALNFQPEESVITPAARAKLARWQEHKDRPLWRAIWVRGTDQRPWPVFVRTGGNNAQGEPGLSDSQFTEVLEWDPELSPRPEPGKPATYPRVIIGMPAAKKNGLFSPPNIKL